MPCAGRGGLSLVEAFGSSGLQKGSYEAYILGMDLTQVRQVPSCLEMHRARHKDYEKCPWIRSDPHPWCLLSFNKANVSPDRRCIITSGQIAGKNQRDLRCESFCLLPKRYGPSTAVRQAGKFRSHPHKELKGEHR